MPKLRQPAPRSQPRRVGQGPEARIRAQYVAERHGELAYRLGMGVFWLRLARQWKRPVQVIKRICKPHLYTEEV